jgi:hypothetical protein
MPITIPNELKRDVLLRTAMRAFKNRMLPIMAFARKFESVPLEGTDKIRVPYFPLATGPSTDFVPANGYNIVNSQGLQSKDVTVNKRKYRAVEITSVDWNRQPFLSQEEFVKLEAEKLADDVILDIFSIITAANFPGTTLPALAASAFDFDELGTMRRLCGEANWPVIPRSVVLDGTFYEYLLRDSRVHNQNYGSTDAVREGRVPRAAGFDLYEVPLLPTNGAEKLAGMAIYPSAIAVAFSPIRPHPVLTQTVLQYEVISDADLGLSIEYRRFADAKLDKVMEVIECNYGYEKLETAALKRIVTP